LTDAKGRKVDFRNAVIIMTSNLGSDLIRRDTHLGFSAKLNDGKTFEQNYDKMQEKVMEEVKKFFRPEFLNRIDASVVFHALEQEHILKIVDLMLDQVQEEVKDQEMTMVVTEAAKAKLAEDGYDPHLGARPLRRLIQSKIEDKLSEEILSGKYVIGDRIILDVDDEGEIVSSPDLTPVEPEPAEPAEPATAT
jgi:ATP-dependent Clp protease ATP-binding subunit ClpC